MSEIEKHIRERPELETLSAGCPTDYGTRKICHMEYRGTASAVVPACSASAVRVLEMRCVDTRNFVLGNKEGGAGRAQCQIVTPHKERSRMGKNDNKSFEGKEFINNEESSEEG
jgi:hypothetical protein